MDEKARRARLDRQHRLLVLRDVCGGPARRPDHGDRSQSVCERVVARGLGRGGDGRLACRDHGHRGAGIVGGVGDREPLAIGVRLRARGAFANDKSEESCRE